MRPLEQTIRAAFRRKMGREPELERPRGLDDKIQWLKLHDQMPRMVTCCDKLAVRRWAADVVDAPAVIQVSEDWRELEYPGRACVVKCNHDSGSWVRISDRRSWQDARDKIARCLARVYGAGNGEWAYQRIARRCFTETLLADPVEYKIHCVEGEARFAQIIGARQTQARVGWEALVDRGGKALPLRLFADRRMVSPQIPREWPQLVRVAEALAAPFRYVRVDLYLSGGRPLLSEMTFWPQSGMYGSPDDQTFGEMLDFDMSFKRDPVHP